MISMENTIQLLLKDRLVAEINTVSGEVKVFCQELLPLSLVMKEHPENISDYVQNIDSFRTWCASRTLMMSQKHAKLICNALNLTQSNSNENKAKIAMAYHCSTLMDAYWIKKKDSDITYDKVSLFQNTSRNILTPISLLGKSESLFNKKLKNWGDIGTDGTLAKSWVREDGTYYLYKAGDNLQGEILAGNILKTIDANCITYTLSEIDNIEVDKSKCFTNENYSFIPYSQYVSKYDLHAIEQIKQNFMEEYANLAVACYLTGNEDLHQGNWGLMIDNGTGKIVGLAPLFDFDGCFINYQTSKNLYFLPEAVFLLEDGTKTAINNFDIDMDYEVSGPTIEEAAIKYAPYCTLSLENVDMKDIPEKYREEFQIRLSHIVEKKKEYIELENEM